MFKTTSLSTIPTLPQPCALTIGSFDGLHLGHRALLNHARTLVGSKGSVTVLTFSNHPVEFFSPTLSISRLCSPYQKLLLLEKLPIDCLINLEFTSSIATLSPLAFLTLLKEKLPFSHLVLGTGAHLGQSQEGDEAHIKTLQKTLNFTATYLSKTTLNGHIISSGLIRKKIQEGDLSAAAALLGRPYTLLVDVDDQGRASTQGLCLPPEKPKHQKIHSPGIVEIVF